MKRSYEAALIGGPPFIQHNIEFTENITVLELRAALVLIVVIEPTKHIQYIFYQISVGEE